MAWLRREEGDSSPQEEQKLRMLFAMLAVIYGLTAVATFIAAATNPAEGKEWAVASDLALAFLLSLLAYKGSKLWSGRAVGARLLAVAAILVIIVLHAVQVIVPLVRR